MIDLWVSYKKNHLFKNKFEVNIVDVTYDDSIQVLNVFLVVTRNFCSKVILL